MVREKENQTDSTPRDTLACHSNSNSSNRSNALAMTGTRKTVVEKTTAGSLKLKELVIKGELLFFAKNVMGHATEFKFDNVYGCRHLRRCRLCPHLRHRRALKFSRFRPLEASCLDRHG